MAITRVVKQTGKDSDGDITSLCNSGESWSPPSKANAINDIKGGSIQYRVGSSSGPVIVVVEGEAGGYLRSSPDASTEDNLDSLPDC